MNEFVRQPLNISLFAGLSGDRRRAYIKQLILSGIILLIVASISVIVFTVQGDVSAEQRTRTEQGLIVFALTLYGLQIVYALVKRETLWQLRWRELQAIKKDNQQNQQELKNFVKQESGSNEQK